MQSFSAERSVQPAPRDGGRPLESRSTERTAPCDDAELRQAIHKLRLTLDMLPE